MANYFDLYNEFEDRLVREFHGHDLWRQFDFLNHARFIHLLLQLGHLSRDFVPWYERAKQGLEMESAKEVLRNILRDEIPRDAPTHQDDRLADLERLGVSKQQALNTRATSRTKKTILRLKALVRYPQSDYDLRVMVTLRIAGEILVAETYRHIVPALMRRFKMSPEESRFYYPHLVHDEKEAGGHTDSFNAVLNKLITDTRTLHVARESARNAFEVRLAFYDQFVVHRAATKDAQGRRR